MITLKKPKASFSLGTKLVLSYLGVALSAILLMVIVVTIAVHNYFYQTQIDQLKNNAESAAQILLNEYTRNNQSWENIPAIPEVRGYLFIMDPKGYIYASQFPPVPGDLMNDATTQAKFKQALQQALQGNSGLDNYQTSTDSSASSGFYASVPIKLNNKIVGAVLIIQPNRFPKDLASDFLTNVNLVILIAGAGIALIVIFFSLLMTRRLTRPLISLTKAAEEMKDGNYTHRVASPPHLDELGRLAVTFNSMADKIAADVNALRIQEQLRRDMIANIAHDLVTPLTAIQGYSEAIADNVISEPLERQETAQLIGREVQRLRRLVSDMQNMTALEAGRVQLELAPLNIQDLVTETLAVIAPECEQLEITLKNEIDPSTPPVLADSDRITQVLLNLLDNARRHTPPNGQITLGAKVENTHLIVWVKDTGVGINPQDLLYIFERFYRVDRSRNASSGGSGLGLAIIKAIITGHGGTAWAQSTLGEGTTILFTLPLANISTPPTHDQASDSPPTRKSEIPTLRS